MYLMLADCKLLHFVKEYEKINGELAISPNMHIHLHLRNVCKRMGAFMDFGSLALNVVMVFWDLITQTIRP